MRSPYEITGPCGGSHQTGHLSPRPPGGRVREHGRLSVRPESRAEEGRTGDEIETSANGGGVHHDICVGVGKKKKKN